MPRVSDMYERTYMRFADFTMGVVQVGTIESVDMMGMKVQGGWGNKQQTRGGRPPKAEPEWAIYFREFERPMRLKVSKARVIAEMFGTEETDEWTGRRLGFLHGIIDIGGVPTHGLLIDQRIPEPLPPLLDPAGPSRYFKPEWGNGKVPAENMQRFLAKAKWDDFLKWLKVRDGRALSAAFGCALADVPGSVIPAMKVYLDELAGINTATGEVATEPPRLAQAPPPGPRFEPPPMGVKTPAAPPAAARPKPAAPEPAAYAHPDMQEIQADDIPF